MSKPELEGSEKWDRVVKFMEKNPNVLINAIPTPRSKKEAKRSPLLKKKQKIVNLIIKEQKN